MCFFTSSIDHRSTLSGIALFARDRVNHGGEAIGVFDDRRPALLVSYYVAGGTHPPPFSKNSLLWQMPHCLLVSRGMIQATHRHSHIREAAEAER